MKKIVLILLLSLLGGCAVFAQSSQRQKMIQMAALRIAKQVEVPDGSVDAFMEMYRNYKKESAEIMRVQAPSSEDPQKAAELKILSDFDKSEKILALRKNYYHKFLDILSPIQIQKMYDAERSSTRGN